LLLDGEELGEVLDRAHDLGGRVVRVARVRRPGVAGLLRARRYEVTVDLDAVAGAPADAARREPVGVPATPGGGPATPGGLAALLAAADAADERAGVDPGPEPAAPTAPRAPATGPAPVVWPRLSRPDAGPEAWPAGVGGRLAGLGVPAGLLPALDGAAGATRVLLDLAARLGDPPELALRPGAAVAVLGRPGPVLETCAQVLGAAAAGPPVRLVLVGDIGDAPGARLADAPAAARLRAGAGRAVVLAAVVAPGPAASRGAADVLAALRPDQVWAALDGARPAAELAAIATLARVDAVAVPRPADCARPGALLGLPVPVGWLGGRPATPVAWAGVLEDALVRMAARTLEGARSG
jgi:hypothetical protein